jgi:GNAT superfamily N-acetyltransferase
MQAIDTSSLRVEAIDNYHPAWPSVLSLVQELGSREALNLDRDGWLPARQVLLAGFFQTQLAGFICFTIVPKIQQGGLALLAQLECLGVADGYSQVDIGRELVEAAQIRATDLKCQGALAA